MSNPRQDNAPVAREPSGSPLGELLRYIAQRNSLVFGGESTASAEDHAEPKSLRHFRDTWSQLDTEQSIAHAHATAPANAGPLNSHSLVLQALQRMHDTSPDYLGRFMAHANALLWLEQATTGSAPPKKNNGTGPVNKKRKSARS